jgi:hypothetical protein
MAVGVPSTHVRAGAGIGVTAVDRDEALAIHAERIFPGRPLPSIATRSRTLPSHELSPWLVLPNMNAEVWCPIGY